MKLPDLNILLYAMDEDSHLHDRAKPWLETTLSGTETVAFAWIVLVGFLRLSTRRSVFEQPLGLSEACDVIDGWLERPPAEVVHPTDRHRVLLRQVLEPLGTAGNLTTDAHLAAMAIDHGAEISSTDSDFSRFPGVRWSNPLL